MDEAASRRETVSEYYGATLLNSGDLRTSACCPVEGTPPAHRAILAQLHPEVLTQFYGCGSPIPDALAGATVLDLGCGTGRDVFLASALVGHSGRVIGVDMTSAQLAVAERHRAFHAEALLGPGAQSNVELRPGFIEDLRTAGVRDDEADVVISNCVCNLCADKGAVWREVARVLRPGGELYFADVYADRRLPPEAAAHPVLVAECLGGALYVEDFRRTMAAAGFQDVRVVAGAPVAVHDAELRALVPDVQFYSLTVRAFKTPALEDRRENYGQTATYRGSAGKFRFDVDFEFPAEVPVPVDGNTAKMLAASRFAPQFEISRPGPHQGLLSAGDDGGALQRMIAKAVGGSGKGCCAPEGTVGNGAPRAETRAENGKTGGSVVKSAAENGTGVGCGAAENGNGFGECPPAQ